MKELTTTEAGSCAICSGYNLQYGDMDISENLIIYEFVCLDCNSIGQETYRAEYIDTTGIKNN